LMPTLTAMNIFSFVMSESLQVVSDGVRQLQEVQQAIPPNS
jgi:hypothetical protein